MSEMDGTSLIQPYAQQNATLNGPGDQRPTAEQVVRDQDLVGALPGLNILITGATSGIGIETARALYLTGANIYITARDIEKGNAVAAQLSSEPARPVQVIQMSLDSFASIRKGVEDLLSHTSKLHVLINNAGIMATPYGKTEDGHELQFGTNHLGHFLLFQLLKPALLAGATAERPSRVVSVASTGHRNVDAIDFDNLDWSKKEYNRAGAYGYSKLANIYFASELTRRFQDQGLIGLSLHPGSIATPLQRHMKGTPFYEAVMNDPAYQAQVKSVEQGAATSVWAAVANESLRLAGRYLENVGEAGPAELEGLPYRTGYSRRAYKAEDENKLWEVSQVMCGI